MRSPSYIALWFSLDAQIPFVSPSGSGQLLAWTLSQVCSYTAPYTTSCDAPHFLTSVMFTLLRDQTSWLACTSHVHVIVLGAHDPVQFQWCSFLRLLLIGADRYILSRPHKTSCFWDVLTQSSSHHNFVLVDIFELTVHLLPDVFSSTWHHIAYPGMVVFFLLFLKALLSCCMPNTKMLPNYTINPISIDRNLYTDKCKANQYFIISGDCSVSGPLH